jgi:competence protein ComEC
MKNNITLKNHFCLYLLTLIVLLCLFHSYIYLIVIVIAIGIIGSVIYRKFLFFLLILLSVLFFAKFKYEYNYRHNIMSSFHNSKSKKFTGEVDYIYNNSIRIKLENGFLLSVFSDNQLQISNININDTISVMGRFYAVTHPTNPGQVNDYKFALNHKLLGKLYAKKIDIINAYNGYSIKKIAIWIKQKIIKQHNYSLSEPFSSMLTALIFGESYTYLNTDIKQLFQNVGLIHALVVSGSQVSLVLSLLISGLSYSHIYRRFQLIFIIPICILFYLITGGGISVLRAIIMAVCFLFVRYFLSYQTSPYNILVVTGLIIVLIDPFSLFKIGAVLSFFTTFSLLLGPQFLTKYYPSYIPVFIQNLCSTAIMPWLFSTPILMIYFHQLQLISLLSNLILIWFIEILVVIGFISTLIGFVSISLSFILHQTNWLIMKWILVVSEFSNYFHDMTMAIKYPVLSLTPIAVFIFVKLFVSKIRLNIYGFGTYLLYFYLLNFINFNNHVQVVFFDVGQGDSCLIMYKNKTILVDTGPKYYNSLNISKKILLPALRFYGINKLDYLIVTHFDSDHDSNIESIINALPIKNFIYSGDLQSNTNLTHLLSNKSINATTLCRDEKIILDDLNFNFLNNCTAHNYLGKNNNSLVFELSYLDYSILFTGDIEKEAELELVQTMNSYLNTTILKVAHHGSKTSSTDLFLNYAKPKFSIISAGRKNRYNHPHKFILEKLSAISTVLQTKISGAILVNISNKISIKY